MAEVFISYKREDHPVVQPMVQGLRGQGLSVWWDQDIPPDAPWELTVERELAAAGAVIVAWSVGSVVSENVKAEARRARHAGKLIQVFLEHCEPPLFFGERQGVNLRGWTGDAGDHRFQTMLTAARAVAAGQSPPNGVGFAPARPIGRQRRVWEIVGGGAIVASTALGLIANLGGARDGLCGITAARALCQNLGIVAAPPPDPAKLAAQARAKLIQSVTGEWDYQAGSCASPIGLTASTGTDGVTRLRVAPASGAVTTGQVTSADPNAGVVVSRDITPEPGGTRAVWEWRPNGDEMTATDNAGAVTHLVRCPAKA